MDIWKRHKYVLIFLFLSCVFLYSQNLGIHGIEYRDDEIFYYKSTEAMAEEGNYLSPKFLGGNRFQKPILFYWFILFFYKIFGVSWFSARFVAVIFAGLSVCVTWLIAEKFFHRKVAWLSVVILITIPLFFRHAKNAVPDMPLNFFTILSCYLAMLFAEDTSRQKCKYLFFISCAFGFMVKGFIPVVIPALLIVSYSIYKRRLRILHELDFVRGFWIMSLIILPWFFIMLAVHGNYYVQYILFNETHNRLMVYNDVNIFLKFLATFSHNFFFYCEVIFSYFAPWSIFIVFALFYAVFKIIKDRHEKRKDALFWMLAWFFIVFIFFSFIYFAINHYLLVLTTPFAILVSYFLVRSVTFPSWAKNFIKSIILFILTVGFLALSFFHVFLAGASKGWLLFYLIAAVYSIWLITRTKKAVLAPMILGGLIIFFIFQSKIMAEAGVAPHSVLQGFAATINKNLEKETIIAVGSRDLHEKEFQIYFDRKLWKSEASYLWEKEQRVHLETLYHYSEPIYCLILDEDYQKYKNGLLKNKFQTIQEDYIFRKRLSLDMNFAKALVKLKRDIIHDYLMEKVVLLKREALI